MSVKVAEISDIPAALPIAEESDEREKLLREAADERIGSEENLSNEDEGEDELAETPKASKKKLFFAFVLLVFGFILLVLLISWFFGIGAFAAAKPQTVDRTKQTNSSNPAPVTEEEKLKMALNLVAEKNPNGTNSDNSDQSETSAANSNSSVDIPPTRATELNEPVVVPDPLVETNRNSVNSSTPTIINEPGKTPLSTVSSSGQSSPKNERNNDSVIQTSRDSNKPPVGRSLFFGIERKENTVNNSVSQSNNQTVSVNETVNFSNQQSFPIPFGTLLPIRFLGAVYTLRGSGGLVRMELTRSISGKNYSYPAGTVLVGTLRGSEYKRAFISVVGLIDPVSGGLVKFEGEVMGNDGASGVNGRRRQIKSTWSRILGGLRETSAVALGAIGNGRSGGTVVISDASSKVSDELSGLIGSNRNANEFVEISAGTTAFVLVTDLPDEISNAERLGQNSKTATGLTESELADLFSEGNKDKIRASLPRMTPQFRVLAEKYLAIEEK